MTRVGGFSRKRRSGSRDREPRKKQAPPGSRNASELFPERTRSGRVSNCARTAALAFSVQEEYAPREPRVKFFLASSASNGTSRYYRVAKRERVYETSFTRERTRAYDAHDSVSRARETDCQRCQMWNLRRDNPPPPPSLYLIVAIIT